MKKLFLCTCMVAFIASTNLSFANGTSGSPGDFNGDNFFRAPIEDVSNKTVKKHHDSGTIPPLKLLRLKMRHRAATADERKAEKEKKKATKRAIKAYQENQILQDADLLDTPTRGDIEHLEMAGVEETKSPQRVVITCDDMDYSTETSILNGNGHVKVYFVEEDTTLTTDHLVYDKRSNHMSAIGNVVITKKGIDVHGESINVDMNEENALIDKPLSKLAKISVSADKGYVYQNKIIQEKGTITVDSSIPIDLEPHGRAPKLKRMLISDDDRSSIDEGIEEHAYRINVKKITINSDKKLDSLELRRAQIYRGNKKLFTVPWIRLYTNKNHDFVEGDFPELGSRRNLGMFIGPGWAVKMPKGSLLKLTPILTYKNKFGIGGFAKFLSGTNTTDIMYGTSKSKFVVRGVQQLDDNFRLEYAANDHMDNWFLGRRMPKYGANLVYEKSHKYKNFLADNMDMIFTHNISFGMFKDAEKDKYYKKLHGDEHTTIRGRYMAEINQHLFKRENKENQTSFIFSIVGQGSAALYGTGDTQFIGRIGPRIHTQYKRWMQDVGYYMTAYEDHTPLPVFDAYRYGHSSVYLREYLRVCRYLTLSWLGKVTLSDDRWNNSIFQECSFFVSVGPDDLKLNIGYDLVRENAYVNFSVGLDPKGSVINYDKLEIKNPENFKLPPKNNYYVGDANQQPKAPVMLKRAVVEELNDLTEESDDL